MSITFIEFFIFSLASFRLTRLIVYDKITEFLRKPFFNEVEEEVNGEIETYLMPKETPIKRFFGEMLSCYWCTGIWSSGLLFLFYFLYPQVAGPFMIVLAAAGVASIIEALVQQFVD